MKELTMPVTKSTVEYEYITTKDISWIASVLNLIPGAVYGGNKTAELDREATGRTGKPVTRALKPVIKPGKAASKKGLRGAGDSDDDDDDDDPDDPERESIKQKLRAKISEKRAERKADDDSHIAIRANRKRKREEKIADRMKEAKKVRKEQNKGNSRKKATSKNTAEGGDKVHVVTNTDAQVAHVEAATTNVNLETAELSGFGEAKKTRVKRRKISGGKLRELQIQLETATKEKELKEKAANQEVAANRKSRRNGTKRKDSESGKADAESREALTTPDIAAVVADREMEKALQRAQGIGVRDDVHKLKKSIRREKRKTEKSKEEWAKRVVSLEKDKVAKQERREKHLKERKDNKGKSGKGKLAKKIHKKRK